MVVGAVIVFAVVVDLEKVVCSVVVDNKVIDYAVPVM